MGKCLSLLASGGLGNQLFQWFAADYLARELGYSLEIDIGWYDNPSNKSLITTERSYLANHFNYVNNRASYTHSEYGKRKILESRLVRFSKGMFSPIVNLWFEPNPRTLRKFSLISPIRIFGHWINDSNRFSIEGINRLVLGGSTCESRSPKFKQLKKTISEERIIALHIRGTDYLKLSELYGQLNSQYYQSGIHTLRENYEELRDCQKIWVFSDDIIQAKRVIGDSMQIDKFVGPDEGLCDCLQMLLMAMADGLVCANSTYSWWAAKFSGSQGKVIFPKIYMKNRSAAELGLIQEDWHSI